MKFKDEREDKFKSKDTVTEDKKLEARKAMLDNKKKWEEIKNPKKNKEKEKPKQDPKKKQSEKVDKPSSELKDTSNDSKPKNESAPDRKIRDEKTKKNAIKKSVSQIIDFRGKIREDLHNEKVTGHALNDGNKGAVGLLTTMANPLTYLKLLIKTLIAAITPVLILVIAIVLIFAFIFVFIIVAASNSTQTADGLENFLGYYQVDGKIHQSLSEAEINEIKGGLFLKESQDKAVTFALSKVGFAYSQPQRTSGKAFDCSSLAYYVYLYAGFDLSGGKGYPPTADAEAKMLMDMGKTIPTNSPNFALYPGDLVFYAKPGEEQYFMNIYHVAIYIGNGYAVEALNTKYGVVYQPLRTKNAILVGHILE